MLNNFPKLKNTPKKESSKLPDKITLEKSLPLKSIPKDLLKSLSGVWGDINIKSKKAQKNLSAAIILAVGLGFPSSAYEEPAKEAAQKITQKDTGGSSNILTALLSESSNLDGGSLASLLPQGMQSEIQAFLDTDAGKDALAGMDSALKDKSAQEQIEIIQGFFVKIKVDIEAAREKESELVAPELIEERQVQEGDGGFEAFFPLSNKSQAKLVSVISESLPRDKVDVLKANQPEIDRIVDGIQQESFALAESLADSYIQLLSLPEEDRQKIVESLVLYFDQSLSGELSFFWKIEEKFLAAKDPSVVVFDFINEAKSDLSRLQPLFVVSPESAEFYKNPIITDSNIDELQGYSSTFKTLDGVLVNEDSKSEYSLRDSVYTRASFDKTSVPTVVTNMNAKKVREQSSRLYGDNTYRNKDYTYYKVHQSMISFDEVDFPPVITPDSKDVVVAGYNNLNVLGGSSDSGLDKKYEETFKFSEADYPLVIDSDLSNLPQVITALSSLVSEVELNRVLRYEYGQDFLQKKYLEQLKFSSPIEFDGSEQAVLEFQKLNDLFDELCADSDLDYDVREVLKEFFRKNVKFTGPIEVSKNTLNLVYEIKDLAKEGFVFNQDDFPYVWDSQNLVYSQLPDKDIREAWLWRLPADAPIVNKQQVGLDDLDELKGQAKSGETWEERYEARQHLRNGMSVENYELFRLLFKDGYSRTDFAKRIPDIFEFAQEVPVTIIALNNQAKKSIQEHLKKGSRINDKIFSDEGYSSGKISSYQKEEIGSFEEVLAGQIVLPPELFPTEATSDNLDQIYNSFIFLSSIDEVLARVYSESIDIADLSTQLDVQEQDLWSEVQAKLGLIDEPTTLAEVAKNTDKLNDFNQLLARQYVNSLDFSKIEPTMLNEDSVEEVGEQYLVASKAGYLFKERFKANLVEIDPKIKKVTSQNIVEVLEFVSACYEIDPHFGYICGSLQTVDATDNQVSVDNLDSYALYRKYTQTDFVTIGEASGEKKGSFAAIEDELLVPNLDISALVKPILFGQEEEYIEARESVEKKLGESMAQEFAGYSKVDIDSIPVDVDTLESLNDLLDFASFSDMYLSSGDNNPTLNKKILSINFSGLLIEQVRKNSQFLIKLDSYQNLHEGSIVRAMSAKIVSLLGVDDAFAGQKFAEVTDDNLNEATSFVAQMSLMKKYWPRAEGRGEGGDVLWPLSSVTRGQVRSAFRVAEVNLQPPAFEDFNDYNEYFTKLAFLERTLLSGGLLKEPMQELQENNDLKKWGNEIVAKPLKDINDLRVNLNKQSTDGNYGNEFIYDLIESVMLGKKVDAGNFMEQLKLGEDYLNFAEQSGVSYDERGYYQMIANYMLSPVADYIARHKDDFSGEELESFNTKFSLMNIALDVNPGVLYKLKREFKKHGYVMGGVSAAGKLLGKAPEIIGGDAEVNKDYVGSFESSRDHLNLGSSYSMYHYSVNGVELGALVSSLPGEGGVRFDYDMKGVGVQQVRSKNADAAPVAAFTGGYKTGTGTMPSIVFENGQMSSFLINLERDGMVVMYPDGTLKINNSEDLQVGDMVRKKTSKSSLAKPLDYKKKMGDMRELKEIVKSEKISMFESQLLVSDGELDIDGRSSSVLAKRRVLIEFEDGTHGFFDFNKSANLLTVAYFLSPTDEDGQPKKEGEYLISPSGSKVKNVVNLDTGGQDNARVWSEDGTEKTFGDSGTNNLLTFVGEPLKGREKAY